MRGRRAVSEHFVLVIRLTVTRTTAATPHPTNTRINDTVIVAMIPTCLKMGWCKSESFSTWRDPEACTFGFLGGAGGHF